MNFNDLMRSAVHLFEAIGVLVLLAGLVISVWIAIRVGIRTRDGRRAYRLVRESFGGAILLSLEFLVAADLVLTVTLDLTLDNVASLALIVLIRTVLSFSLEIEIEGVAPWRRAMTSGASHVGRAVTRSGESAAPNLD
jgi:uncharacterized membrane protein